MTKIEQLIWKWNQPRMEPIRLLVGFAIVLPTLAACIWALTRLIG